MAIFSLAVLSLRNRFFSAAVTALSIALSVSLLLGVERLRNEARDSFANTLTGTDLIVGARTGPVQLLLYSVFRMGDATNNISWDSLRELAGNPMVAWSVPLSLGDSHRGYRVLGTSKDYFQHYRYADERPLSFAAGRVFDDVFDAVLGAEVAARLDYSLDVPIVLAHGGSDVGFARHDDKPFRVVGILAPTGTPVDRTVHVSLGGIEAIHVDWRGGVRVPGLNISADAARQMDLEPETVTAALFGLKSKVLTFKMQRLVNDYTREPLLAILPGVALSQLWELVAVAENALFMVSACVVLVGLCGMLTVLLTSLNERRREMAILRAVGARPIHLFGLVVGEAMVLTAFGALLGVGILYLVLWLAEPWVTSQYGIVLRLSGPSIREAALLGVVLAAGTLAGVVPAIRAYRMSLADGLTMRI